MLASRHEQNRRRSGRTRGRRLAAPTTSAGLLAAVLAFAFTAAHFPAPPAANEPTRRTDSDDAVERASRYFEEGRYRQAVEQFDRAIVGRPKDPKLYAARGDAYVQSQNFRSALRDYNKALEYGLSDKPWLYTARGDANAYLGDYASALADYQSAIDANESYAHAYAQRALVLEEMGRLEEALADCSRSIALTEQSGDRKSLPLAYTQRAAVLRKQGKLQDAIADCQTAMKLSPRFPPAFLSLGNAVFDMGQLHTAIGCYNCAIDLKRDYARAYYRRGLAYRKVGDLERAGRDLKKARQIDPDVQKDPLWKR